MDIGNLLTLITLALTLILSFSELRRRRGETRSKEADAAKTITDAALGMLKPKEEEINSLREEVEELKRLILSKDNEIDKLRARILILEQILEFCMDNDIIPSNLREKYNLLK